MSDKVTPRGLKLTETMPEAEWCATIGCCTMFMEIHDDGLFLADALNGSCEGTESECLAWIDARAEETFRALGVALHGDAVEDVIEEAISNTHDIDVTDAKYARAVAKALGLVEP